MKKLFPLLALAASAAWAQAGAATVASPDGRLTVTFLTVSPPQGATEGLVDPVLPAVAAGGQLVYSVSFQGKPLIDQSMLGLELQGQTPLGPHVRIAGAVRSEIDETYKLIAGKTSSVRNQFHELRVDLEETATPARKLAVEARVYDDAVAFRYVVPDQTPIRDFRLIKEDTEFRIGKDAMTYPLCLPNYRTGYEGEFIKIAASGLAHQGGVPTRQLLGLPLLMEVPGVAWLAITEADLRDNAAMYLVNPSEIWGAHRFEARLAPNLDEPDISISGSLPHHSAWRVLPVGTEPGRLIESNTIGSLNPDSAIRDTSWIHAGRVSWPAWNTTTRRLRRTKATRPRFAHSPSSGSGSCSVAGRMAKPMTNRPTSPPCGTETRRWPACSRPPGSSGSRVPGFKDYLRIPLDGLSQMSSPAVSA
jgi:alpha-glucosidase